MKSWLERGRRMSELQQMIVIYIFNEAGWEYQCLHTDLQQMMTDEEFQDLKKELYPIYLEKTEGKDLY